MSFEANINSGSQGQSPAITFTARMDPVKVTASLSAATVTYGNRVTATGTVTYEPVLPHVPLAGRHRRDLRHAAPAGPRRLG